MLRLLNAEKVHSHTAYGAYAITRALNGVTFTATVYPVPKTIAKHRVKPGKIVVRQYSNLDEPHQAEITLDWETAKPPAICVVHNKLYVAYRTHEEKDSGDDKLIGFGWIHLRHLITKREEWHHHVLTGVDGDLKYRPDGLTAKTDNRPALVKHDDSLYLAYKSNIHTLGLARFDTEARRWHWLKNSHEVIHELDIHHQVPHSCYDPAKLGGHHELRESKKKKYQSGVRPISDYTIRTPGEDLTKQSYEKQREKWIAGGTEEDSYKLCVTPVDNYFHSEKGPSLASFNKKLLLGFKDNHRAEPGNMNAILYGALNGSWPPAEGDVWEVCREAHSDNTKRGDIGPGTWVCFSDPQGPRDCFPWEDEEGKERAEKAMTAVAPAFVSWIGTAAVAQRLYVFFANARHHNKLYFGYMDAAASTVRHWRGPWPVEGPQGEHFHCHGEPMAGHGDNSKRTILVSVSIVAEGEAPKAQLLELQVELDS